MDNINKKIKFSKRTSIFEIEEGNKLCPKFNKEKLKMFLKTNDFKIDRVGSFILFSPFLALISFKFSLSFINIDNLFCKIFPGFLLFAIVKKQ